MRTKRPEKTKIGTKLAHVTRDSDTTFKVKRSKVKVTRPLCSPPCWRVRRLQRWAWDRVGRGKLLLRCRLLGCAKRFGDHGGGEGRGHNVAAARLYSLLHQMYSLKKLSPEPPSLPQFNVIIVFSDFVVSQFQTSVFRQSICIIVIGVLLPSNVIRTSCQPHAAAAVRCTRQRHRWFYAG